MVVCTNTMHKVADQVQQAVRVPLIHIGDVTARAVVAAGVGTVALLGTRFTMRELLHAAAGGAGAAGSRPPARCQSRA
ncbi:aspartate/glutamate racemase family protein, partial [Bacillus sp. SIMBA_074]|uniref:aspartate/glutamate racemase family protein n=1 Tax=Bacillus sp. SIMBA_074 TaxID=3085812 RepID=UPI00397E27BB